VQLSQMQPYAAPPPPPAPAAPPPSPEPARVDVEAALAALLADPERLERVRAAIIKAPAAVPAPQPPAPKAPEPAPVECTTPPNPAPAPAVASNPAESIAGGLEAALGDVDIGKLFAGIQALTAGGAA